MSGRLCSSASHGRNIIRDRYASITVVLSQMLGCSLLKSFLVSCMPFIICMLSDDGCVNNLFNLMFIVLESLYRAFMDLALVFDCRNFSRHMLRL